MTEEYKRAAGGHRREAAAASANRCAVLFSAGLDSAVLVADMRARRRPGSVLAIYVAVGFAWEAEERAMAARLFASPSFAGMPAPVELQFDMRDVFPPDHWAVLGRPPGYDTPDEDVYLHGRNVILLSKAAVYLSMRATASSGRAGARILLGTLAGNPFADATPEFFATQARALSLGLAMPIAIEAPYAALRKSDVIKRGVELGVSLELTLSCMQPAQGMGMHCGRCSKCRERQEAFREAAVPDPTQYRHTRIR